MPIRKKSKKLLAPYYLNNHHKRKDANKLKPAVGAARQHGPAARRPSMYGDWFSNRHLSGIGSRALAPGIWGRQELRRKSPGWLSPRIAVPLNC
jgi:hypothetical protein